jgi:hypothetical protein
VTEHPTGAHRSTAPADRAAEDVRSAQAGSVETQRRPAPATGDAQRHEEPEESHDERVTTPVGPDEHPERGVTATGHGPGTHEGGHVDAHSDSDMAAEHAAEEHTLGPIDVRAWGAALAGVAVAGLVAYLFYLAIV